MTTYSEWLELVSGLPPYRTEVFNPTYLYIRSGRDLAQLVHYDYTFQIFTQAALIILNQFPETVLDFNLYQLNNTILERIRSCRAHSNRLHDLRFRSYSGLGGSRRQYWP